MEVLSFTDKPCV